MKYEPKAFIELLIFIETYLEINKKNIFTILEEIKNQCTP